MKKTMAVILTVMALCAVALPAAAGNGGPWKGWITDDSCGAKGAKAEHKDCAMRCLENGGKLVFYNSKDQKIYQIDKQEVAKEHIGHEVTVGGKLSGDTIQVESIMKAGSK